MAGRQGVDVEDLVDLQRSLEDVRAAVGRRIERASEDVARLVGDDAKSRAQGLGSTAAHVAPSIREDGGTVGLGGSSYPMAAGAEFGGRGRPTTQQFEPYRADGYFLYPAIRGTEDQTLSIYEDAIDDLTRRHDLS